MTKPTRRTSREGAGPRRVARPSSGGPASENAPRGFALVAVGGGAGSLNAFTQLLARLPSAPGLAFLFMSTGDLPPQSNLASLLENASVLPVIEVTQATSIRANQIYVPAKDRTLLVSERGDTVDLRSTREPGELPLDLMFRSLAAEANNRGIGVLLSGKGADGVLGLAEIKSEGGIIFVQDEGSATHTELISAAIAAGVVDFTFPPRRIGEELVRLAAAYVAVDSDYGITEKNQTQYARIFALLRALTAVDFSQYKPTTLGRRIRRRMFLSKAANLEDYLKLLQQKPSEVDLLFQDILINVTSFFRDPAVFQTLKKRVFPRLLKEKALDAPLRIWVPGCSTGEEVYSIAMALVEFLGKNIHHSSIQIFATDISEAVLNRARNGVYPETISAEVSQERLRRFFHRTDAGFQISKYIRDFCIFARQNLFEDPPFSKLDFISCRNVLIYLGPLLQKKVIPIFHYALKPHGFLLLGGSETIGVFSELFSVADKQHKLYKKRIVPSRLEVEFSPRLKAKLRVVPQTLLPKLNSHPLAGEFSKQVDRILLSVYAPSGVVVNSSLEVLQFRGQTGPFVEHAPGDASLNLFKMVRETLAMELRSLVSRATKIDQPVRKEAIPFVDGKLERLVTIDVIPFKTPPEEERYLLVLFSVAGDMPSVAADPKADSAASRGVGREALRLHEELLSTKESLQAIIEEQETTNEELKSANEEIQSSNEELQSTNEELETAKEELQSTNEELTTLNEELQSRNLELTQANSDFNNLLASVNLPILMLGNDLSIRRFTPAAERLFSLIATDVGRMMSDINPNVAITQLDRRVRDVIDTLETQEHDVQDREGRWYSLRIRPYRTSENKIDGAVLMLVDINETKRGLEEVIEMVNQPLLVLGGDFRVHRANRAFYQTFAISPDHAAEMNIFTLANGQWNIPQLHALLESILPEKERVEEFRIEHQFPSIGLRALHFSARVLHQESKGTRLILLAIEDVTP